MYRSKLAIFILILMVIANKATAVNILCCDGGGVRAVLTLELLVQLKKETGVEPSKHFDVYAGTSIGGVVAIFLSLGLSPERILKTYKQMSTSIFSNYQYSYLIRSKYKKELLRSALVEALQSVGCDEDLLLCELPKKVVIPTVELYNEKQKRWRPVIRENFTKEGGQTKVIDALLETTAAPTYFRSHNRCIDGGAGMNDPSLFAVSCVRRFQNTSLDKIKILSIGTGYEQRGIEGDIDWGVAQWRTEILPLLIAVGDQVPAYVNQLLFDDAFMRIDIPLPYWVPLDDYKKIEDLTRIFHSFIEDSPEVWANWCQWINVYILDDLEEVC